MMSPGLLVQALQQPEAVADLSEEQWDLLVRQGRRANLLATLALRLDAQGAAVPPAVQPHLQSARLLAQRQRTAIQWEVTCIQRALQPTGVPVLLLKGAAYVMAALPVAEGRLFGDVDIIVPRARLADVEAALLSNGWEAGLHDAYDQRYYREWMHEIPPLHHRRRGSVIDVHHAVLPETARVRADSRAMIDAAVPVPGCSGLLTFGPLDMVLHSATHLFHEGEFDNGLRDLFDLDGLLRHFGREPGFWTELPARAARLGLQRPLHHALRYAVRLLGTPLPEGLTDRLWAGSGAAAPGPLPQALLDFCFQRALRPVHGSCDDAWSPAARGLLYVRSHWLRMPLPLLLRHLARKALVRNRDDAAEDPDPADQPPGP